MDIINKKIDGSVDAQKQAFENKKAGITLENNAYAHLRQKGLDDRQAALGAKQAILDHFLQQTEEISSRYASPLIQQNAENLKLQLQAESRNAKWQQYILAQPKIVSETEKTSVDQTTAGGGKKTLPAETVNKLAGIAGIGNNIGKIMDVWKAKAAGPLNTVIGAAQNVGGDYNPLQNVPTDVKQYREMIDGIVAQIGHNFGEGRFSDADAERYRKAMPTYTDSEERALEKVRFVQKMLQQDLETKLNALDGAGYNVDGVRQNTQSTDDFAKQIGAIKK